MRWFVSIILALCSFGTRELLGAQEIGGGSASVATGYDLSGLRATHSDLLASGAWSSNAAGETSQARGRPVVNDLLGRVTSLDGWNHTYSCDGLLLSSEPSAPAEGSRRSVHAYDALGRRVRTMVEAYVGGQWTAFSATERDFLGRLPLGIETSFADGSSKSWRFMRGPDASGTLEGAGGARGVLAVLKDASSWKAVAADTLGNVLAVAGTSGDFQRRTFDPWGNPLTRDASGSLRASTLSERRADYDALPLAWASQEVDPDTGLTHYHFREYSPSLGGWLTRDPIGLTGGYLNLRSYLGNRPVDVLDVWGEKYESEMLLEGKEMEARGERLKGICYQMAGLVPTIWNSHVGIHDEMQQGLAESDEKFRAGEQDGSIGKWEASLYYSLRATTKVSSFRGAGALTGGVKLTDSLARDFGGTTKGIGKAALNLPGKVVNDVGSAVQDPTNLSALWRVTDDAIDVKYTLSTAKGVASTAKEVASESSLIGSLKAGAEALRLKTIEQTKAKCPPCKEGVGSTASLAKGTTVPRDLREQLAIEQVRSQPEAGKVLPIKMNDPKWSAEDGWAKMQQIVKPGGEPINVHYVRNTKTGEVDDFKIVIQGSRP